MGPLSDCLEQEAAIAAQLMLKASAGSACLITWQHQNGRGELRLPANGRGDRMLDRLLAITNRAGPTAAPDSAVIVVLQSHELAPLMRGCLNEEDRYDAAAAIARTRDARIGVILIGPSGGADRAIEAAVELGARLLQGCLTADAHRNSRDFWQQRASESAEQLLDAKAAANSASETLRSIEAACAAARKLRPSDRFSGLGSIMAREGPFAAWIAALAEDGEWRVAAVSGVFAPAAPLNGESALVDCHARRTPIVRVAQPGRPAVYAEDRLFARFAAYLCIPFDGGAIALAACDPLDSAIAARLEHLAGRLNPLIRSWMIEAEAARLRALIRKLSLRMYGAVEAERARIARDLHDHQAQLLAAARIALEAGPDEARAIFKQVEDALRLRVRELRPALLGRTRLAEALRYELRRLAEAGIKGRLIHADQMNRLTRPVQQLCYQVAREALSNVVRHAGASRVEITITKQHGRVHLAIRDNGKGIAAAPATGGVGLKGLRERIELMGGKLKLESRPGATRLIADLVEPT
ncbi:MAG: sensor histidine kinase [Candidatus Binataceae bacterium]